MQVRLILLSGSRVGEEVRVDRVAVLGRNPDCELHLDDAGVSRRHARVRIDGDEVWLEDLGSSNGTKVSGQRVKEVRLEDGDVFELAKVKVRVKSVRDAAVAPGVREAPARGTDGGGGFEELEIEEPVVPRVSVPKAPAAKSSEPRVVPPAAVPPVELRAAPKSTGESGGAGDVVQTKSGGITPRVAANRSTGVLGEDLSQQSGPQKILVLLVAFALAAAVFWIVFSVMR